MLSISAPAEYRCDCSTESKFFRYLGSRTLIRILKTLASYQCIAFRLRPRTRFSTDWMAENRQLGHHYS
jgi:hypothetical protein